MPSPLLPASTLLYFVFLCLPLTRPLTSLFCSNLVFLLCSFPGFFFLSILSLVISGSKYNFSLFRRPPLPFNPSAHSPLRFPTCIILWFFLLSLLFSYLFSYVSHLLGLFLIFLFSFDHLCLCFLFIFLANDVFLICIFSPFLFSPFSLFYDFF